jgi:transposase
MKIDIKNLPKSSLELKNIIFSLHQSFAEQEEKLVEKQNELASFKSKYENLIEQIRLEKQRRFAPKSEANLLLQPDIFDEAGIDLSDEVKAQCGDEKDAIEIAAYTRKKHPVRKPLPSDLPREVIVYDIAECDKICGCGNHLVNIGQEMTEQLKYIPAQLSVVQHVRLKYACKPCEANIKIAPMPALLLPKSMATPELVTQIIIAKYCDHIPLYRQEKIWNRLDIDLPRSSLCGWVLKTAELCEPLIKLLQKNIVAHDLVQADETTVQVMDEKDRPNTSKSYMWCYRGKINDQINIVYEYQETRGGTHAEAFLSGFKGFLQTDAYAGYNFVDKNAQIISVGCHAHARRPFAELVKIAGAPGLAHQAIAFYRKLYAIEDTARQNNLPAEARFKLRNEKSKPVLVEFKKWLDHHLTKTSENGKIGKAIRYCLSNWEKLNNYLNDGRIEIDNNLIENAIRPFAIGRKNWMFMGSPKGAKAGAIFYSLIETCKANHIEPNKYFCAMLHKIPFCTTNEDYQKLLPWNIELS